ncbi:restriction endonuclease subunit S [Vibrio splendidus]|uniref:restriction endonuclease subunit S n=1 Tax=Vibrio splendidus TaxID=29497 RepID=UPI000D345678|nr:restriction endonuclease subunit S [Vibrio splendidus]PTO57743.1 restriction endonuclease subunit S [Vibrio splendidus]PTP00840.1 restriction endonuclease subunit S [Vibrio splendidus]
MGSKWEQALLGELIAAGDAVLQTGPFGTALKAEEYTEIGVPLISVREIREGFIQLEDITPRVDSAVTARLPKFVLQEGDIVFARKGGVERNALITEREKGWFVGSDGIYLRLSKKYDAKYFSYVMRSPQVKAWLLKNCEGTTMPSLNQKILARVPIFLPSKIQQEKIADLLFQYDEKITINNQINQTLEKMAQTLFKSWFVDFDPVKAKMNGEQPKGMDTATASLFPEKLVESELGLIPEGWDVGTLSDVAKYCSARTNTDTISLENYISTENMLAEKKGVTAASKLPTAKTVAAYKSGDILVSNIRPYFKKIWLAEGSGGRSNDVLGFESVSENTDSYLMNLLYQDTFFEYMTRTSKGAKMPRGDKTAIMNWEMAVPPVELREAFSAIVDKFYQLIPQNRAQNATLESLRDTLLPKLLSGEIDLESVQVEQVKELAE